MYLNENCPDNIGAELWPPHSPELNPFDYSIWGILEKNVMDNNLKSSISSKKDCSLLETMLKRVQ